MEDIRRRLLEDLTDTFTGDLRVDSASRALYSTDASLYEVEPLAVCIPRTKRDVEVIAEWSADQRVPIIARGSGTGLAGGCIGRGIIVDFSRYMNKIISIGSDTVRVQAGVRRDQLNAALRSRGRYLAPDPSNSAVTTIGGMLGVDAAGSHAVRVGSARDHVQSLECVLSGGQRMELGVEQVEKTFLIAQPTTSIVDHFSPGTTGFRLLPPVRNEMLRLSSLTAATRKADILERLNAILDENAELIRQHQPAMVRNCAGYMLRSVRQGQSIDLPRLLVGSEGTLAMFTEATLYTLPVPEYRAVAMLMFGTLDQAIQAMQLILPLDPSACDLLDRRLLSLGRSADASFRSMILPEAEGALILEFPGHSEREVRQRLADSRKLLDSHQIEYRVTREGESSDDIDQIWSLPGKVVSLLAGLKGSSRPLPFVEDVAVPPERLTEFMIHAQRTFQQHEVTATFYSHAASGQLHLRPILAPPHPGQGERLEAIARDLYRHVFAVGGTVSGEHGDGFSRTAFLRTQYGPLYRVFQQIKDIFDPERLMNPDKIISNDPQLTIRHLRKTRLPAASGSDPAQERSALEEPKMQLSWSSRDALDSAVRCNGCGTCTVPSPQFRMCPFVSVTPAEELTPRAKANAVRRSLSSISESDLLTAESMLPVLESCFNCRQCQTDCPSGVDIPHLVIEARAQRVASVGLSKTGRLLSRIHVYANLSSRFAFFMNRLLKNQLFRKFLGRTIRLAPERRLPRFAGTPFLQSSRVRSEENTGAPGYHRPTVVYFVDYFANHHDPDLAEALCRILEHNGFRVFIPTNQTVSGMSMISVGDIAAAAEVAEQNVRELAEPAREGYPILCTEPSAALCLSEEYPLLLKNEDVHVVSKQTTDAGSFLLDLHRQGRLRTDFTKLSLSLIYHTPCHVRSRNAGQPMVQLLSLIPGITVRAVEKGCSGMAGTWGLAVENFQESLKIGQDLIQEMQTARVHAGTTDCSSCRMQMEQGATIPTIHPLKLLAFAYGLMPRIGERLKSTPTGLTMS